MEVVGQLSDFELLENYQKSLSLVLNTMNQYISVPNENVIDVTILGAPFRMQAKEFKEHLSMQMHFFQNMIDEVQDRINRSEGKVC